MSLVTAPMPADQVAAIAVPAPVLVAGEDDVEQVMRTAKAGIAILSLQLRSLQAEVVADQDTEGEAASVEAFLDECLGRHLDRRRTEMAAELERVRSDAARLVLGARASAAELVAQAGDESLGSLLALQDPPRLAGVPSLRVISEAPPEAAPAPAPAPPLAAVLPPPPAPMGHPAGPGTPATAAPLPPPDVAPLVPQPAVITLPEPGNPPAVPAPDRATAGSRVSRFLYLDVLLPMVAVLLLVFLLLAWVG